MSIERLDYVDFLKGIGILLVVWSHTNSFLGKEIFAFHMPLFAFLSGLFCYKEINLKDIIIKKSKTLLIPFFVFSFLWWVVTLILLKLDNNPDVNVALKYIFYILGGSGQNSVSSLSNVTVWFLPYLFVTFIIHTLNSKFKFELFGVVVIGLSGVFMSYTGISLPYSIDTALTLYPIFYFGSVFIKTTRNSPPNIKLSPIFLFIFIISCYMNSKVDTASNVIGNPFLFYISAFSAICFFCFLTFNVKKVPVFNYIGERSMDILIFHMMCYKILAYYSLIDNGIGKFIVSIFISLLIGSFIRRYVPQFYGFFKPNKF